MLGFGGQFNKQQPLIGVDVGHQRVRLVQMDTSGNAVELTACASEPVSADLDPQGEAWHNAVAQAIHRGVQANGFVGRKLVTCLPFSAMRCKSLRLPIMPPDETRNAVMWEAAERLRFPPNRKIATRHLFAGECDQGNEKRQELIVLAMEQSYVEQHVARLVEAGYEFEAVDATPTALARVMNLPNDPTQTDPHVLVDIGAVQTKVLIRDGRGVRFFKGIELGVRDLDQRIAQEMRLAPDEATAHRKNVETEEAALRTRLVDTMRPIFDDLAKEVALCLRYDAVTFRGARPETVQLTGEGAPLPGFNLALSEAAGVSGQLIDPFATCYIHGVERLLGDRKERSVYATAIGAALYNASLSKSKTKPASTSMTGTTTTTPAQEAA